MTMAIFINYETILRTHMQFVDTNISYDIYIKIIREEATVEPIREMVSIISNSKT